MPLEFACIEGVVHHIPKLKEDAKNLSRREAIPLHRALDRVAQDVGVKDGWHSVIFKKWAYHNDGHIYQISPVDKLRRIRFDALANLSSLPDDLNLHISLSDISDGDVPVRDVCIQVSDHTNVAMDAHAQKHFKAFLSEKTLRAGCIFAIYCADHLLEARNRIAFQTSPANTDSDLDGQDGP